MNDIIVLLSAMFSWLPSPMDAVVVGCCCLGAGIVLVDLVAMCWRFIKG